MSELDSDGYFSIGNVTIPSNETLIVPLKVNKKLSPRELDVLGVLCEHVNRLIDLDSVIHRLDINENTFRIARSKLHKKLHHDWLINVLPLRAIRLLYLGNIITSAERTYLKLNHGAVASRYFKNNISTIWTKGSREDKSESIVIKGSRVKF